MPVYLGAVPGILRHSRRSDRGLGGVGQSPARDAIGVRPRPLPSFNAERTAMG